MAGMERLTVRDSRQHAWYNNDGVLIRGANGTFHQKKDMTAHYIHDRFVALDKVIDHLASYEDIGMEPEEVVALRASFEVLRDEAVPLLRAKIEDRLLILPCKPDEIFYQWKKGDDCPSVSRFEGVEVSEDGKITYPMKRWGGDFHAGRFR